MARSFVLFAMTAIALAGIPTEGASQSTPQRSPTAVEAMRCADSQLLDLIFAKIAERRTSLEQIKNSEPARMQKVVEICQTCTGKQFQEAAKGAGIFAAGNAAYYLSKPAGTAASLARMKSPVGRILGIGGLIVSLGGTAYGGYTIATATSKNFEGLNAETIALKPDDFTRIKHKVTKFSAILNQFTFDEKTNEINVSNLPENFETFFGGMNAKFKDIEKRWLMDTGKTAPGTQDYTIITLAASQKYLGYVQAEDEVLVKAQGDLLAICGEFKRIREWKEKQAPAQEKSEAEIQKR